MSADRKDEGNNNSTMFFCAGCGIAEGVDVQLKKCACYLVRYCGVKCQRDHRPQHKRACKKRITELRDELLFKRPEISHHGDCPICCLPLPLMAREKRVFPCCCKVICSGCFHANVQREREARLEHKCPFCRHPPQGQETERILMKRVEANDPFAMREMGVYRNKAGDHSAAVEYFSKAAELGDIASYYHLSQMYSQGHGVEKDEKKEIHHLEEAAIGGHLEARYYLGGVEEKNGRLDRAMKHWIIAANMGYDNALKSLKLMYQEGLISKEDFAAALRAHQAAVDATKSPQREEAEQWFRLNHGG